MKEGGWKIGYFLLLFTPSPPPKKKKISVTHIQWLKKCYHTIRKNNVLRGWECYFKENIYIPKSFQSFYLAVSLKSFELGPSGIDSE